MIRRTAGVVLSFGCSGRPCSVNKKTTVNQLGPTPASDATSALDNCNECRRRSGPKSAAQYDRVGGGQTVYRVDAAERSNDVRHVRRAAYGGRYITRIFGAGGKLIWGPLNRHSKIR